MTPLILGPAWYDHGRAKNPMTTASHDARWTGVFTPAYIIEVRRPETQSHGIIGIYTLSLACYPS